MALTRRQKEFLDYLSEYLEKNGHGPSYEEIASGLDLASLATVHKHMLALETKGYLKRDFNRSRSLQINSQYYEEQRQHRQLSADLELPVLGKIAAGRPIDSATPQEPDNFGDFTGNPDMYALQVRGESMIDDHICDGDYVLVKKADQARNGEIVVALVGGEESTLKRFYRESEEKVRLQPANSSMEPIYVHPGMLQIQGKVLAVLRKY